MGCGPSVCKQLLVILEIVPRNFKTIIGTSYLEGSFCVENSGLEEKSGLWGIRIRGGPD